MSDVEYSRIRSVVVHQNPSLQKYKELSNSNTDRIIAEHVNTVLEIPLIQDTGLIFKVVVVLFWLLSFVAPVYLFMEYGGRFGWYFI